MQGVGRAVAGYALFAGFGFVVVLPIVGPLEAVLWSLGVVGLFGLLTIWGEARNARAFVDGLRQAGIDAQWQGLELHGRGVTGLFTVDGAPYTIKVLITRLAIRCTLTAPDGETTHLNGSPVALGLRVGRWMRGEVDDVHRTLNDEEEHRNLALAFAVVFPLSVAAVMWWFGRGPGGRVDPEIAVFAIWPFALGAVVLTAYEMGRRTWRDLKPSWDGALGSLSNLAVATGLAWGLVVLGLVASVIEWTTARPWLSGLGVAALGLTSAMAARRARANAVRRWLVTSLVTSAAASALLPWPWLGAPVAVIAAATTALTIATPRRAPVAADQPV